MSTLGILGGGQLGRMTAFAAIRLGLDVKILAPGDSGPAAPFSGFTVADWSDPDVLAGWAEGCDVVTVESEWAPADLFSKSMADPPPIYASPETLHVIRHKGRQKRALDDANLPLPPYVICNSLETAHQAANEFTYPVVLKRFEGSYDGYGNATCHAAEELAEAWNELAADDGALVESFIDFEAEAAVQVARRPGGEAVVYPLCLSEHRNHKLHAVMVPSGFPDKIKKTAMSIARQAVEVVDGVGLTAVELFVTRDGNVLINELAPRPHNTGHYTIDACHASQFENHVRGVYDLPLGDPGLRVPAACMVNVLGERANPAGNRSPNAALDEPTATVHLYGKYESRPGRKMGHVTVTASDTSRAHETAERTVDSIAI